MLENYSISFTAFTRVGRTLAEEVGYSGYKPHYTTKKRVVMVY